MNRSDRQCAGDGEKPAQVGGGDEVGKDPAAQALGAKGGKKRAERLTAQRRSEIAKLAASARWAQKQMSPNETKADGER